MYRGPGRRRRTIAEPDGFRFLRVLPPLASLPVGEHGCRPPDVRPSPPPIGWLTGFWATPRWCGFLPIHRLRPAFPRLMFMWSAFEIDPMLARQVIGIRRISPLGSVSWAHSPSRFVRVALHPADRQICPPRPGCISTLWTDMPRGTRPSGRQLPTRGSASGPLDTVSPALSPSGARMYAFSPSVYWMSAIQADRFGSYSIDRTLAATPSFLFRLKSIRRYIFLCPPPRNRTVMTPWLFRPPFFGLGTRSDFSGLLVRGKVHSAKSDTDPPRRPAEVGLY